MEFPRHLPDRTDTPLTTLYLHWWRPPAADRQAEIELCLRRNLDCPAIDRIIALARPDERPSFDHPRLRAKLLWVDFSAERATYRDLFAAVNACTTTPWDLNIVANSDIWFDESLQALKDLDLFSVCVALSRWEGESDTLAGDNSQDCWIFQGPVRPLTDPTDVYLGTFGCDWRIAWVLRHNDYALLNCPFDVRVHHVHQSPYRNNLSMVPGPHHPHVPYQRLRDVRLPAGRHQRGGLLSWSLWGDQVRYLAGAVENAKLARWLYPEWTARFWVDDSVSPETLEALRAAGAEVLEAPRWPGWHGGLFWRLLAADEPGFVRWGIRDCDSRLTYRERLAVDQWIASGLPLHTVRDHPGHKQPIMGCCFGGQRAAVQDMAGLIARWRTTGHGDHYGSDEAMLRELLWPQVKDQTLVHTDLGDMYGHGGYLLPFPCRSWENGRFVGEHIYEDNHHHGEDRDSYLAARWHAAPQTVPTREELLDLIPAGSRVAEIGVFRGDFARVILLRCRPAELHLVDLWRGSASSGDKDGRNVVTILDMKSVYRELLDEFADQPAVRLHRGDSVEVLRQMAEGSLDAAYLDSSHEYQATLAELAQLQRVVRPGGWIMAHDYQPGCPVYQAVNEWLARTGRRIAYITRDDGCPSIAVVN
jgi:hypothetical protein